MSEKNHTVALGAFVIGSLLIALAAGIFFLGAGLGSERTKVFMVFDGSVKGLTVGAPVALRGVNIGQVTDIELLLDTDPVELIMLVEAELRTGSIRQRGDRKGALIDDLVSRGLGAQLNTQSLLTGLLYVQLDFRPDSERNLAQISSPYLQIPTVPTGLERISREFEQFDFAKVAGDLAATAQGLSTLLTNPEIQALPENISSGLQAAHRLGHQLTEQLASSGPRLDRLLDSVADTSETANTELSQVSEMVEQNLALLKQSLSAFENTLSNVNGMVSPDSPASYELTRALRELANGGRALQSLARTLEEQPEAILRGKRGDAE